MAVVVATIDAKNSCEVACHIVFVQWQWPYGRSRSKKHSGNTSMALGKSIKKPLPDMHLSVFCIRRR